MDPLTTAQREARIVELRAARVPFRQIATELGISHQRVAQIYQSILDRYPVAKLDQHREEERELADRAVSELMRIAANPDTYASTRVKAWDSACRWAERKARLLGLDAPQKREIEILDTTSWEAELRRSIEETERELRMTEATNRSRNEETQ